MLDAPLLLLSFIADISLEYRLSGETGSRKRKLRLGRRARECH